MKQPAQAVRPLLGVRQVREFSAEPVDRDALDAIADAARWSGSSQNKQPWRFIVITERASLDGIAEVGLPSTRALQTAPAAIAVVLPGQPGSGVTHAFDEGRAAERILIAATFCGLAAGVAWIRSEARPRVGELLGLPEDRFVRTVVAIGHAAPEALRPKSAHGEARLPREETVFEERWRT